MSAQKEKAVKLIKNILKNRLRQKGFFSYKDDWLESVALDIYEKGVTEVSK